MQKVIRVQPCLLYEKPFGNGNMTKTREPYEVLTDGFYVSK